MEPSASAHRGALRRRAIQGPEEERPQEVAVDLSPSGKTVVHRLDQKPRVAGQPSSGLNEIEKEDPGELEQGDRVPVGGGQGPGRPAAIRSSVHRNWRKKTHGFAAQHVHGMRCETGRATGGRGGQTSKLRAPPPSGGRDPAPSEARR